MQTPEEFARLIADECVEGYYDRFYDEDAVDLIAARDEAIRADERGRCSIVHATLSDEALVAELVRRGVFEEEREHREVSMLGGCWTHGLEFSACKASCTYRPDEIRYEWRFVGPWQQDARTDEQRSDDAVDEMRRRLKGDAP